MADAAAHADKAVQAPEPCSEQACQPVPRGYLAVIPDPPPHHAETEGFWHYGWLMTTQDCEACLQRLCPNALIESKDPSDRLTAVTSLAEFLTDWDNVEFVLVRRTNDMPKEWESARSLPGLEDAMSFLMIVSTARRYLRRRRPRQRQLVALTEIFGKEPVWMMCAMSKREFSGCFFE
ncbi:hypothetical protein HDZ31DRAFT_59703 [Schizophyllum fasciatum]